MSGRLGSQNWAISKFSKEEKAFKKPLLYKVKKPWNIRGHCKTDNILTAALVVTGPGPDRGVMAAGHRPGHQQGCVRPQPAPPDGTGAGDRAPEGKAEGS